MILLSLVTIGDVSSLSLWYYILVIDSRNTLIMRLDLILVFDSKGLLSVNIQPFAVIPSGFNIRNRRFLTFYFLIYIEPIINLTIISLLFLTFYFLIYIEPEDLEYFTGKEFLTFYFLIYIEPCLINSEALSPFLTFYFLINTNIPSLP